MLIIAHTDALRMANGLVMIYLISNPFEPLFSGVITARMSGCLHSLTMRRGNVVIGGTLERHAATTMKYCFKEAQQCGVIMALHLKSNDHE